MSKNHQVEKDCSTCTHWLYLGEGDHVCDLETAPGALVTPLTEDFQFTDHYFWCGGKRWKEA